MLFKTDRRGANNPNWRGGKKRVERPTRVCQDCGGPCWKPSKRCLKCSAIHVGSLHKGRKHAKEHVWKRTQAIKGEGNASWKGNKVGLSGLHEWVRARLPKPELCEVCKRVPPRDLANQGTYDRNLSNWRWLCRRCHLYSDGRIEKNIARLQEYWRKRKGAKLGDLQQMSPGD